MDTFFEKIEEKGEADFYCKNCDYKCTSKYNYTRHISTNKHKRIQKNENIAEEKGEADFYCKNCDCKCSSKYNYTRHISTNKHKHLLYNNIIGHLYQMSEQGKNFLCNCGKKYKYSQGLSKHKQRCAKNTQLLQQPQPQQQQPIIDANLIIELIKQNQELQKSLIELSKEKTVTNNSINSNNNNKTFNIQLYLNEDCKNALNLSEFVSSIQLQLHDLEETGRLGYVDGVSQIINTKLNDLDATMRPIQCSDVKRETLYIKEENTWFKEDDKKEKIKNAIKQITRKNIQQIPTWVNANPGCTDPESKYNDKYLQIVFNAMSGDSTEEQTNNLNKIVSKVSKEVAIDK